MMRSVFEPNPKHLRRLGYDVKGGKTLMSRFRDPKVAQGNALPGAQPQPISVVTSQPSVENRIQGLDKPVNRKKLFMSSVAAAALDSDTPEMSYARATGKSPCEGIEETWNPLESLIVGPMGMAGAGGRAAGVALDMILNAFLHSRQ